MMNLYNVIFFLFLSITSCKAQSSWEGGGKINKVGIYENENIKIIVTENDDQIEYFMFDFLEDTLVKSDRKFSSFQRWALHLDKDVNLWVFSSDIGHSCWKRDTANRKYVNQKFIGGLLRDSISEEVWNTLKEFYPYNKQK